MSQPTRMAPDQGRARSRHVEPILVSCGLTLAVGYRAFEPIWSVGGGLLALGTLTAAAYLTARLVLVRLPTGGWRGAVLLTTVVSQPVLLALALLDLPLSRIALGLELLLLLLAVAVATTVRHSLRLPLALAFVAIGALPTLWALIDAPPAVEPGPEQRYVFTSYHDVSLVAHEVIPHETQDGGALALLPDGRLLLVAGSGAARVLDLHDGVRATPVELGLPMDVDAVRALGRPQPEFYRVFDALYVEGSLFVSYTHWDPARDCYALRLAQADFDGQRVGPWATRFESKPCVPLPYPYNTSGGRIALLDAERLLLTVGAFGLDLLSPAELGASDYGKILVFDRATWRSEVFTKGHRNPEGLLVEAGRIWSTEHGPHGGDELNVIVQGTDYGWPAVSYGTDYGTKVLALGGVPGEHDGFAEPVYTWTPSIGISSLIRLEGDLFPSWRGDLLIGSLSGLGNGNSVFRVRIHEGRVIAAERIQVGGRVRDVVQLPADGSVVLWDGAGTILFMRPADHVFGACSGCHGIRNAQHAIGPDLFGVVGSPVARHATYRYSPAMLQHGGSWTPERLDRFLASPRGEVPGTSMEHDGITSPAERADVIRFLSEISAGRPTR